METTVQVLRTFSAIDAIRSEWEEMQWHPNSDFASYRVALRSMSGNASPYVLVVRKDSRVDVVLVGRIERSHLSAQIGYSTIAGPRIRQVTFIYGGLLGRPSSVDCELLVATLMHDLSEGEADVVFFNHLQADSELYRTVTQTPGPCCRDFCHPKQVHLGMRLAASSAEFRGRLSSGRRKHLRWQERNFEKAYDGNVTIRCASKVSDFDWMIRDLERVAVHTYQRGLGAGFQNSPGEVERLRFRAEKQWLRTYILYAADNPCAFWSGTLYAKTFHSDFMGFDPCYRQYSPGMYLIMKVIDSLCSETGDRDVSDIDFGLGDAEYKRMLSDHEWRDASPLIFAPRMRGFLLNAYHTPLVFIDRCGRRVLNSDLQTRIKRLWRDRISRRHSELSEVAP